jgi:hypothetical protein
MIVLLSPAKRLVTDRTQIPATEIQPPAFLDMSQSIMNELKALSPKELQKLQGISPELAEINWQRNQNWTVPAHDEKASTYPAVHMFDGEVYRGLNAQAWKANDRRLAQQKLRILSGLYGVLRPFDAVLPYRLEMGTALKVGKQKSLYDFWRNQLKNTEGLLGKGEMIVNLASAEYFKMTEPLLESAEVHNVQFLEQRLGSNPKPIQVYVKKARGLLANYIIQNNIESLDGVRSFKVENYTFSTERSNSSTTVFIR